MLDARYLRLPSHHLGRAVHLWTFGRAGQPVVVFPSAAGMAHEWQVAGGVEALAPWIRAGRLQLLCPENNAVESWFGGGPLGERLRLHRAYTAFVVDELVPWARAQTGHVGPFGATGVSLGALYACTVALKHPEVFPWALCLSGRYRPDGFLGGWPQDPELGTALYYEHPLAFVPNLHGAELDRVRAHAHLTLVVGRGPHEGRCVEETHALGEALEAKGISTWRDTWGPDVAHHWSWWRRQLHHHVRARFGPA